MPKAIVIEDQQLEHALKVARVSSPENGTRDAALLLTCFGTGMTVTEICRLRVSDYLDEAGGIRVDSNVRAEVAYTADQTRLFARQIGLQPVTTPVRSPQSNGMAESFVKTIKRDYVAHMPKPDRETALRNLAIEFEHHNEQHPHSALNYRSPREFRRLAAASV